MASTMRTAALAAVLCAACAPPVAAPASPPDVKQMSHAIIDAFDRGDVHAVDSQLALGFIQFEGTTPRDRAATLARARERLAAEHVAQRTWSNEHSFVAGDDAVYIGEAAERGGGNRGSYIYDGYYTLSWHRAQGAWQLALWTWKRAGDAPERDFWDDVFKHDIGFEHAPNQLLVDSIANEKPGKALDVAMGQGRNALYLASKGWTTTGVDWSAEGIAHAREQATKRELALEIDDANIDHYDFGDAKWDLVTMIYAGADKDQLKKIVRSLKPGGLLVFEYFVPGPDVPDGGIPPAELDALLKGGFDIVRDDIVEAVPDWAVDKAKLQRLVARKR
jgi:SAM-dependent methyltransferase